MQIYTATHCLKMWKRSEKCIINGQFYHCVYITEHAYANLAVVAHYEYTLKLYGIAPRFQACTARHCTKQRKITSSTGEGGAAKSCSKHKMYEATAGTTQHTVLQQKLFLHIKSKL